MELTPQQDQVLALISAGSTISQAARSAGIHRNSIHNWLRSAPPFQLALADARQAKAFYWHEQAEELAADAILTVRTLMTDPKTPAAIRLKAALSILTLVTAPPPAPAAEISEKVHNPAQPVRSETPPSAAPKLASFPEVPPPAPAVEICTKLHNTAQSTRPAGAKIGRNDLCLCGSGLKFKRCCLAKPAAGAAN